MHLRKQGSILPKINKFSMNKLVVVTGATRGIGRAIAARFAREGFDIATCSRNKGDLDRMKSEMEQEFACTVITHRADLSHGEQARRFTAAVADLDRPIDVLINNAGYFSPGRTLDEPEGTLEEMIGANLYSAYYTTRGLLARMVQAKRGHVFNLCSIASLSAYPNGGAYTISKFALLGFTKVLREELKTEGIRVTAILPGATRTVSWDGTELPDERFMTPEDVADAVYSAYALSGRSVVEEIIMRPQLGDI
jgi:short-subunit dehydrogenase